MSNSFAIGYERLLELFEDAQKQSPKGVSLRRIQSGKRQLIYLQFKIGKKARKPYPCNCTFSLDGIASAKELNIDIPAYNDTSNEGNIIYIGKETILGTTVKTGDRFSRLIVPPSYPNLTEKLDTLNPKLPDNKPRKDSKPDTIRKFYANRARKVLVNWKAPITQTHADRNLCNLLGLQAGVKQEIRSQSLGHTPLSNENSYKNAQSIQTQLDILRYSNQDAIDFVAALNLGKKLVKTYPSSYQPIAELLAQIYGKNEDDVMNLL